MGEGERCAATRGAYRGRQSPRALRRHYRQPVGEDDGKRGVRGYDAGKKIKGRKRHILVDTMGMLLGVRVHAADIQDRDGGRSLLDGILKPSPEPPCSKPISAKSTNRLATADSAQKVETPALPLADDLAAAPPVVADPVLTTEIPAPSLSCDPAAAPPKTIPKDAKNHRFPRLTKMWADSGYVGSLEKYLPSQYGIDLEIVRRSDERVPTEWVAPGGSPTPRGIGFKILPHRWIVERTHGWIGRNRRLSKDYEHRTEVSETWILMGMSRLMVRRLTRAPPPAGAPVK